MEPRAARTPAHEIAVKPALGVVSLGLGWTDWWLTTHQHRVETLGLKVTDHKLRRGTATYPAADTRSSVAPGHRLFVARGP